METSGVVGALFCHSIFLSDRTTDRKNGGTKKLAFSEMYSRAGKREYSQQGGHQCEGPHGTEYSVIAYFAHQYRTETSHQHDGRHDHPRARARKGLADGSDFIQPRGQLFFVASQKVNRVINQLFPNKQ